STVPRIEGGQINWRPISKHLAPSRSVQEMPIRLGVVGHFSLAVRDPRKSARWWTSKLGLRKEFAFPGGIVVGNDAVAIALFKGKPRPDVMEHMSFHLSSMSALRAALAELRRKGVDLEDPGDEIGPE